MKIRYRNPKTFPFSWASAWGEDQHGIWIEFQVKGVIQRMRWIYPGEFLMGSPDDEPERYEREKQCRVILTEGFWLADTACTQELWTAVKGKNPSRFKGADLPVERVSWEDCREFLEKVNQEIPGLNLTFPTEAQWEYACRAGTITPFSFGENITPDQVNYRGNYPYADGKKGLYREKTVPVKSLPCNAWGLYEMHGNVWEWCRDWYGEYPKGSVTDPEGPEKGGGRVLRGGSWINIAADCRSAIRSRGEPGYRDDSIGFRFSRGHPDQQDQAEPGRTVNRRR